MEMLKFLKVRNVNAPVLDKSGTDVQLYIPNELYASELSEMQFVKGEVQVEQSVDTGKISSFILLPQKRLTIPLGLKVKLPTEYSVLISNNIETFKKSGLTVISEITNTEEELTVCVTNNTSETPIRFYPGQCIAKLTMVLSPNMQIQECFSQTDFEEDVPEIFEKNSPQLLVEEHKPVLNPDMVVDKPAKTAKPKKSPKKFPKSPKKKIK